MQPADQTMPNGQRRKGSSVSAALLKALLRAGENWIDDKGRSRPLQPDDVLIVAPYNA